MYNYTYYIKDKHKYMNYLSDNPEIDETTENKLSLSILLSSVRQHDNSTMGQIIERTEKNTKNNILKQTHKLNNSRKILDGL